MYNDYRNTSREGWKYHYTGEQLLPAARSKLAEVSRLEAEARARVADLLRDPGIPHNDKRIVDSKHDIEKYGNEREQCSVFVHEFGRNPSREYALSLGDVTYFDLAAAAAAPLPAGGVDRTQEANDAAAR